jgi:probable HAF family extracellular repeat protein
VEKVQQGVQQRWYSFSAPLPDKQGNNRCGFIVGVGLTVQSAIRYQGRIRGRNKGKETTFHGAPSASSVPVHTSPAGEARPSGCSSAASAFPFESIDPALFFATDHAFLWTRRTGMRDLGTLPGDVASGGTAINDRGEVVGPSLDASGNPRAFLWKNGVMTDLNTLVPANAPLFLLLATAINSSGEIAGFGVNSTGGVHGFLATPRDGEDDSESLSPASHGATSPMALSEDARKLLQQRLPFGLFGGRLVGPR